MIPRPPRSTPLYSSAASDVYKRFGEGDPPRVLKRHPPGDGDADAAGGPHGQGDMAGPPGLYEKDGADAVEDVRPGRRRGSRRQARTVADLSPRNRTASGPTGC